LIWIHGKETVSKAQKTIQAKPGLFIYRLFLLPIAYIL